MRSRVQATVVAGPPEDMQVRVRDETSADMLVITGAPIEIEGGRALMMKMTLNTRML